jgi:regulator of RNase E activity RraA
MPLNSSQIHQLRRWNTPTIANALEQISDVDPISCVNRRTARDFMPEMGAICGRAVTVEFATLDPKPKREQPDGFVRMRDYFASVAGPKIVVVRDRDQPQGAVAIWGEVGAYNARALGCIGTITDGHIRDFDEMRAAGFKALARELAVSHGHGWPVSWGAPLEVFGCTVRPGQLVHADKHGFIVIPEAAEERLLEAARFMDDNECHTVIAAGLDSAGRTRAEILAGMAEAGGRFGQETATKFGRRGEW